ncbi:MAG: electron transport complex subunit E [Candidatus Schekmanbacteria bacterium]|nr:electron transport complex subunit E [Candidatus Schekmanbacteria bacterium]
MATKMDDEEKQKLYDEFVKGIWRENPVFIQVLGLCPSLAVTNSLMNGIAMGAAVLFVLVCSSFLISLLRNVIPKPVRISIYIVVIATFVTAVDFTLAAVAPDLHKSLGAFIALIVVNCLILGRAEAFAGRHGVKESVADAIGMSIGFTLALCLIGGIREALGNGTLLGYSLFGPNFEPWVIMILPPGGFLTLGAYLFLFAYFKERSEEKKQRQADAARNLTEGRRAA